MAQNIAGKNQDVNIGAGFGSANTSKFRPVTAAISPGKLGKPTGSSPGKLGKSSRLSEALSSLRMKGAMK